MADATTNDVEVVDSTVIHREPPDGVDPPTDQEPSAQESQGQQSKHQPHTPYGNAYHVDRAAIMAAVASHSYASLHEFQAVLQGHENLTFGHGDLVELDASNPLLLIVARAQILRTQRGRVLVVSFRGTEPTNLLNWGTDLNTGVLPWHLDPRILVHEGFLNNFRAVWDGPWGILAHLKQPHLLRQQEPQSDHDDENHQKEEKSESMNYQKEASHGSEEEFPVEHIYFTGHSLGGSMAMLGGLYLAQAEPELYKKERGIYTFGQPMGLHPTSCRLVHSRIGDRLFRHVYHNDLIPQMPSLPMGRFAHVGQEYRFFPSHDSAVEGGGTWKHMPPHHHTTQLLSSVVTIPFVIADGMSTTLVPSQLQPYLPKSPWSMTDHSCTGYCDTLMAISSPLAQGGTTSK